MENRYADNPNVQVLIYKIQKLLIKGKKTLVKRKSFIAD